MQEQSADLFRVSSEREQTTSKEHANEQTSDYRRPNELRETTAPRPSSRADRSPDIGALGYWSIAWGIYCSIGVLQHGVL